MLLLPPFSVAPLTCFAVPQADGGGQRMVGGGRVHVRRASTAISTSSDTLKTRMATVTPNGEVAPSFAHMCASVQMVITRPLRPRDFNFVGSVRNPARFFRRARRRAALAPRHTRGRASRSTSGTATVPRTAITRGLKIVRGLEKIVRMQRSSNRSKRGNWTLVLSQRYSIAARLRYRAVPRLRRLDAAASAADEDAFSASRRQISAACTASCSCKRSASASDASASARTFCISI